MYTIGDVGVSQELQQGETHNRLSGYDVNTSQAVEEEGNLTPEELAIKNVGKQVCTILAMFECVSCQDCISALCPCALVSIVCAHVRVCVHIIHP